MAAVLDAGFTPPSIATLIIEFRRAAALVAEEVYIGVRRTALALRAECDAVAKAKPAEQPVVTAQVQETLL